MIPIFIGMIRTILFAAILISATAVKGQVAPSFMNGTQSGTRHSTDPVDTNRVQNKWSVVKYAGISTGFVAFKGGGGSYLSAPLALQVNRQLTNNLYAFGGVSVTPYLFHSNIAPYQPAANKNNSFMQTNHLSTYSDAKIGVMYINNEKTFSISGSIGVSRGGYNNYSPFYAPVYAPVLR